MEGERAAGPASANGAAEAHDRLDSLLEAEVAPQFGALARTQTRFRLLAAAALAAPVLLAVLTWLAWDSDDFETFLVATVIAAMLGPGAAVHLSRSFRGRLRDALMPPVCRAIGGIRHQVGEGAAIDRLPRLAMVAPFNGREIDDVFQGEHAGIAFTMAEIALRRIVVRQRGHKTERRTRSVFKGLLFAIATPQPIAVPILLRGPDWFLLTPWRNNNPRNAGLVRVTVPDRAFARRFGLWTTDGEAALAVVTPDFAALMVSLSRAAGWRGIDAGFDRDRFLLLLPRVRGQFEAGGLLPSLNRLPRDAHRLLDQVLVVHRLIDSLRGAPA